MKIGPLNKLANQILIAAAIFSGVACTSNNSADTEQAAKNVRKAQDDVNSQRKLVDEKTVDVVEQQQALAKQDQKLSSVETDLAKARAAYTTAVGVRFAKLDANLAELAKKTDAKAKDAYTGLHARREQLATKLAAMAATADTGWTAYTKDTDTTFDAIEHDLGDALR